MAVLQGSKQPCEFTVLQHDGQRDFVKRILMETNKEQTSQLVARHCEDISPPRSPFPLDMIPLHVILNLFAWIRRRDQP